MNRLGRLRMVLWGLHYRFVLMRLAPLRRWWERRGVTRTCPAMGTVFRALDEKCGPLGPTERSCIERTRRGIIDDTTLTYGELGWPSFLALVERVAPRAGDVFVELGCGTGQFCFYMRRHHGLSTLGVDRVECLVQMARDVAREGGDDRMDFEVGDYLELDFSRGTIFYAATTCMSPAQLHALARRFEHAPPGARMVCLGRPLEGESLDPVDGMTCGTSWGEDTAWVYRRA